MRADDKSAIVLVHPIDGASGKESLKRAAISTFEKPLQSELRRRIIAAFILIKALELPEAIAA